MRVGFMSFFLAKPQRFLVRPASGWLDVARKEVEGILTHPLQKYKFSPELYAADGVFSISNCDFRQAMELVLRVSTCFDVEWVLQSGRVNTRAGWSDFFQKAKLHELWGHLSAPKVQVAVSVSHPVVGTSKDVRSKLVNFFRLHGVEVPASEEVVQVDGRVRIECEKNRTQILVSMGGDPLYRRHYKATLSAAVAPLAEHHAAACFDWALNELGEKTRESLKMGKIPLVIPFGGSGTLGFEGVCRVLSIASGIFRKQYGFELLAFSPGKTTSTIRSRLPTLVSPGNMKIVFGDIDPNACAIIQDNAGSFKGLLKESLTASDISGGKAQTSEISCINCDFLRDSDAMLSEVEDVFFALNPPYGERLAKKTGGLALYQKLGSVLRQIGEVRKVEGFVLCGNESSWRALLSSLGKFRHKTRHFTHGGIDIRIVVFSNHKLKAGR